MNALCANMTERMNEIAGAYDSIYNGLTMCVGSYASSRENDVISMVDEFASKINFVHLRNVEKEEERGSFVESDHLSGDVDMYEVRGDTQKTFKAIHKYHPQDFEIPLTPFSLLH